MNKVYFFIFGFAFFRFMGTIGSNKGFYFPDYTLSFYVIPIAYCLFNFSKEAFITIMKATFRIIFIYIIISLCYWFFNISYIKIPVHEWITSKIAVGATPAYDYIGTWSGYSHPSYISLVLFSNLIIGFYLLYKSVIPKFELITFIVCTISLELILESRIGLVGVLFIIIVSILYYAKLKTQIFRRILFFIFLLGVIGMFFGYSKLDSFVTDVNRKTDYTLAINYIKDNLWWGAGTMGQEKALIFQEQKMLDVLPSAHNKKTYVHNMFLGEMVQYGVWGLLVTTILLGALAVSAYKSRNYLYQVFLMVFILFLLIEEPLYVQEGITYFMVYLTFFIAVGDTSKTRKSIHLN
ncbi:MAG: O-antigen ligase family protein [Paludibacteraceae bacterium]